MNGEDGDFTMRMSRLGYTSRLDPKVVVYEGVPESFFEMREQRIRWSRATIHNQSRHGVYRAGRSAPSVWFTQTNQYFRRVRSPIFFVLPLYIAAVRGVPGVVAGTGDRRHRGDVRGPVVVHADLVGARGGLRLRALHRLGPALAVVALLPDHVLDRVAAQPARSSAHAVHPPAAEIREAVVH